VKLLSEKEKLSLRIGETVFYYRRIRPSERKNIIDKYTVRGKIENMGAAVVDMLRLCVTGWDGVLDENDNEVPFDSELLHPDIFPEQVLVQLEAAIVSAFGNRESEEKNS